MSNTIESSPGMKFDLTVKEVRVAMRKASSVFAACVLTPGGDPTYLKVTKQAALESFTGGDDMVTTAWIYSNGDVYID